MINYEIIERFARLEAALAAKKGDFMLFGLFTRGHLPDRWDLIVAAPWLGTHNQETVEYLVNEIKSQLGAESLTHLSSIVIADPHHAELEDFNRRFHVEHGDIEIRDEYLFGQPIKVAHIITSKRPAAPVVK